jgi:hypothetical protein
MRRRARSLDEAAAAMPGQLLGNSGIAARIVPREAAVAANLFRLDAEGIQMACLSYLEPGDLTNARYLVRRLRRKMPGVKILIGFWTLTEEEAKRRAVLKETSADAIVRPCSKRSSTSGLSREKRRQIWHVCDELQGAERPTNPRRVLASSLQYRRGAGQRGSTPSDQWPRSQAPTVALPSP